MDRFFSFQMEGSRAVCLWGSQYTVYE